MYVKYLKKNKHYFLIFAKNFLENLKNYLSVFLKHTNKFNYYFKSLQPQKLMNINYQSLNCFLVILIINTLFVFRALSIFTFFVVHSAEKKKLIKIEYQQHSNVNKTICLNMLNL